MTQVWERCSSSFRVASVVVPPSPKISQLPDLGRILFGCRESRGFPARHEEVVTSVGSGGTRRCVGDALEAQTAYRREDLPGAVEQEHVAVDGVWLEPDPSRSRAWHQTPSGDI